MLVNRLRQFSLQQQLLLPYVLLVMLIAGSIVTVSYRASTFAVDDMARKFLVASSDRISKASEQPLTNAMAALESAVPDPIMLPGTHISATDLGLLERRFWVASALFPAVNSYVYFGSVDGSFIGVDREYKGHVEVYLREPDATQRQVFEAPAPGEHKLLRTDNFDPRQRSWYQLAAEQQRPVWSPVYTGFSPKEPMITLAKPIYRGQHQLIGVLSTDITMRSFTEFMRTLDVGKNGIAFVMDAKGMIVATSGKESPVEINAADGSANQRRVLDMSNPLMRAAAEQVETWRRGGVDLHQPVSGELTTSMGGAGVTAVLTGGAQGIDWVTVVAMPRSDFMGGLTRSIYESAIAATALASLGLLFGWLTLSRVLRDVRKLTNAAQKIGDGEPMPQLDIESSNEIGQLAQTFTEMEYNLRTDRLTGVGNRAWLHTQINSLQRHATHNALPQLGFGLLFVDLDNFKPINDRFGHEAGDHVLATVAGRLRESVRQTDLVARYGGDEFVILLKSVKDSDGAAAAQEKIRLLMTQPIQLAHDEVTVGASLGWAIFPQDGQDVQSLLKAADARMFEDKKARKAGR